MSALDGKYSLKCVLDPKQIEAYFQTGERVEEEGALNWVEQVIVSPKARESLVAPVSVREVGSRLGKANSGSAPGLSGISFGDLKDPTVYEPLAELFPAVLRIGKIPSQWKKSKLTMIYKTGSLSSPKSWRPIALRSVLLSCCSEFCQIGYWNFLRMRKGFPTAREPSSELTGALSVTGFLTKRGERPKNPTRATSFVWIDLQNAFGSVRHNVLLAILKKMGIPVEILNNTRCLH